MEAFLGLVILILMGWGAIKLLMIIGPKIWFMIVFPLAAVALVSWVGFLEASGLSIIIGIFGAIAAAWAFAKAKLDLRSLKWLRQLHLVNYWM